MIYLNQKGLIRLSLAVAFVFAIGSLAAPGFGQSDNRLQGSDSRAGELGGQQSPDETDPFQLPDIPQVPSAPVVNPQVTFQDKRVDEKYAGWRQAGDGSDGQRLDDIVRAQWVMADDAGQLRGIVYGIEGADLGNFTITLLNKGRVVTTATPKEDGTFIFPNVRQDAYALVGWGDNAFFAFSFNILRFNEAVNENVPAELQITAVPNKTSINTDWMQYFSTGVQFWVYGLWDTNQGEDDPPRLYGFEAQQLYMPPARPATSISSHQVVPAADGRLIGRVHQMSGRNGRPVDLKNTRIMLLQNDDVYAAVTTDRYGVFEFSEVPAGEYSCVAVGQDGLGCIGINVAAVGGSMEDSSSVLEDEVEEAVENIVEETLFAPISFTMVTSETTGWLNNLAIETAYQRIISRPIFKYEQEQQQESGQRGCAQGSLRPGGYRPLPRNAIPPEQRFNARFNRFVDKIFYGTE